MPPTTLRPVNDLATQRSAIGSVPATGRARRSKGTLFAPAIGLMLLAPHATFALELGEASIKSALGESLIVEIPYRLADSEQVVSACVGLAPPNTADDLPTYTRATRISVTPTHIQIYDDRRVVEPLIGLNIEVHCAGAPHFVRSYQLFVDPPTQIPSILSNAPAVAATQSQPAIDAPTRAALASQAAPPAAANVAATSPARTEPATTAPAARTERTNSSPRARGLEGGNLPQGQTYRVVRGDTLSGIAARIANRPVTINEAADAIFAANPAAFTRGNPDLIEEGRSITIPTLAPAAGAVAAAVAAPAAPVQPAITAANPPTAAPVAALDLAPAPPSAAQPAAADVTPSVAAPEATPPTVAAQPTPAPAAPIAAPVPEPTRAAAPSAATQAKSSGWLVAAIAVAAFILLAASAAFVRARRKPQDAEPPRSKAQEPARRRPIELPSQMDVVEGSLTGTHARQAAALRAAMTPAPAASPARAAPPPDLSAIAQSIASTDAVDFDVGAAVAAAERTDDTDRAYIIDAREDTLEDAALTTRLPNAAADTVRQPRPAPPAPDHTAETVNEPIDDEKDDRHTLTVVELDMLRQDYETEHTLTQQSSQALRDAVADLEATKKAHAATAETATLESPQVAESADNTINAPTARLRTK
jgi:hypothetical protein